MWCRAAGFEPATTRLRGEGTPACASGRLGCGASSFGCEARIRTDRRANRSEAEVRPAGRISWFRARRGAGCTESRANRSEAEVRPGTTSHRSGWRDSNSQLPAPRAGALPLRHIQLAGTDGRIRTDTGGGLSAVPLPVGLRQHWWTEPDSNGVASESQVRPGTGNLLLARESRFLLRHRPVVAGAGIEPARRAYDPADRQIPRSNGDGVTGRTRTGFFRGHVPACRPLLLRPQSTREESNLRHPLCKSGGLATDLLVVNCR